MEVELSISSTKERIVVRCDHGYRASVFQDLQQFLDAVPGLKFGETFYFGFWPLKLLMREGVTHLAELDFAAGEYVPYLDKSVRLWNEQSVVNSSQGVHWQSTTLDQLVHFTPSVFKHPIVSTVEGAHFPPENPESTGWLLYTSRDREQELGFETAPVCEILAQFNLSILRFLGLPTGWMFNIDMGGNSYVWKEDLS